MATTGRQRRDAVGRDMEKMATVEISRRQSQCRQIGSQRSDCWREREGICMVDGRALWLCSTVVVCVNILVYSTLSRTTKLTGRLILFLSLLNPPPWRPYRLTYKPGFHYSLDSGALIFACVYNYSTQPDPTARGGLSDKRMQVLCNTVQMANLESRGKGLPGPCKGLYHPLSLAKVSLVDVLKRRWPPDPSANPSPASHASSLIW